MNERSPAPQAVMENTVIISSSIAQQALSQTIRSPVFQRPIMAESTCVTPSTNPSFVKTSYLACFISSLSPLKAWARAVAQALASLATSVPKVFRTVPCMWKFPVTLYFLQLACPALLINFFNTPRKIDLQIDQHFSS